MNGNRKRSAEEVINQAVLENKANERLLYILAAVFATVGLSVLVWAIFTHAIVFAGIGVLTSALFWPALEFIRRTRRENIAIRLLEIPLTRVDTAKEASQMLRQLFDEIFGDKRHADQMGGKREEAMRELRRISLIPENSGQNEEKNGVSEKATSK